MSYSRIIERKALRTNDSTGHFVVNPTARMALKRAFCGRGGYEFFQPERPEQPADLSALKKDSKANALIGKPF